MPWRMRKEDKGLQWGEGQAAWGRRRGGPRLGAAPVGVGFCFAPWGPSRGAERRRSAENAPRGFIRERSEPRLVVIPSALPAPARSAQPQPSGGRGSGGPRVGRQPRRRALRQSSIVQKQQGAGARGGTPPLLPPPLLLHRPLPAPPGAPP